MSAALRALFFLFVFSIPLLATAKVDKLRCMWRSDPSTSMVIGWNQISGSSPEVCFGEIDGGSDTNFYPTCAQPSRAIRFKGMYNYFARLENLSPNTEYFFVIVDSEGTSRRYSFKTTPATPDQPLSIIAGGDSRNYRNSRQRANQMVSKLRPDFVMFGGDMTGGDSEREWKEWMDDWQLTITEDGHMTPIVATRGNHEYSNQTIADLFDVPSRSIYYKLTFGGNLLEVYTLNSLIASGGNQKTWLRENLENSNYITWKMAQYHYAIRPHTGRKTERNDQLSNWAKYFYQYKMNLVVESDAHCVKTTWPVRPSNESGSDEGFIRDDENGTVYVGEGCWGAPLRKNNDDKNWTRNSGSFNQFKWIFVDANHIEVRTVKTDNAAMVASVIPYDRFSEPAGIDIWNPSNGPVLSIYKSAYQDIATASGSSFVIPKAPVSIKNPMAQVVSEGIQLSWDVINSSSIANSFLVQRSNRQGEFETLAKVEGTRSELANFSIMDVGASHYDQCSYRLVCASPGRESAIAHLEFDSESKVAAAIKTAEIVEDHQGVNKTKDKALSPDENSGYLRVKYTLGKQSDVSIRLIKDEGEVTASKYQNQREGNYLKSIDMSEMPSGEYQLIIKVDQRVVHEYAVRK